MPAPSTLRCRSSDPSCPRRATASFRVAADGREERMGATGRFLILAFAMLPGAAHAQEHTIRVALTRSIVSVTTLAAIEKGYFREHGIRIEIEDIDSSVNAMALLAQNRLQVVEGGISAG